MSPITIRPLTDAERPAFFRLGIITFGNAEDVEQRSQRWRWAVENSPDYDPIQVRSAFRDEQFLGGCIVYERTLAIGPSRLLTGCIGAVVTHPDHRLQGVASALLSQLVVNLRGLTIDRLETEVARDQFDLLGFFYRRGFAPSQRLAFSHSLS